MTHHTKLSKLSQDQEDALIQNLSATRKIEVQHVVEEHCYLDYTKRSVVCQSECNIVTLRTNETCPSSSIVCTQENPKLVCVPRDRVVDTFDVNDDDKTLYLDSKKGPLYINLPKPDYDGRILVLKRLPKSHYKISIIGNNTRIDDHRKLVITKLNPVVWLQSFNDNWYIIYSG